MRRFIVAKRFVRLKLVPRFIVAIPLCGSLTSIAGYGWTFGVAFFGVAFLDGVDWHLLQHPPHGRLLKYMADLNHLYRAHRSLWEVDFHWEGFEWIDANDALHSTLSFLRFSGDRKETLLCAFNFTPVPRHNHRLGVPHAGHWEEILNSDAELYGGANHGNYGGTHTQDQPWHDKPVSLTLTLPPLGAVYLRHRQ